jgi:hypothetical protein
MTSADRKQMSVRSRTLDNRIWRTYYGLVVSISFVVLLAMFLTLLNAQRCLEVKLWDEQIRCINMIICLYLEVLEVIAMYGR